MSAPTDRDLILRARRGDAKAAEAYCELITRYQTSVFNVCYRILHNYSDAEDLAQETFIRVYDRLHTFDLERDFSPWVRRVAANLCLNHLETQKSTAMLNEERDDDKTQNPSEQIEIKERSDQIRAALAS